MHLKSIVQNAFNLFFLLALTGCDNKAEINFYDKNLKQHHLKCLQFNPKNNGKLEQSLINLYPFDPKCKNILELSYKSDIVCKSPYNTSIKNTSAYPNAYIELEVRDGFKLLYSYYKDLYNKPDIDDLKDGFDKLKDDIL